MTPIKRLAVGAVTGLLLSSVSEARIAVRSEQKPLGGTTQHSASDSPFTESFARFTDDVMQDWKVPGMAIAVIDGDNIYTEGFGYATLPDVKVTPETLFFTGSTSKAFTDATLAVMIDSKNYSALSDGWHTTISSVIREDFVLQDSWATNHLTLDDAASHRTGFPRHDLSWARRTTDDQEVKIRDVVRNLRNLHSSAEPRTTWQYCNIMYVTLSHVIETLTGQWLGDTIRQLIWEPLGMNATFGDTKAAMAAPEDLASGYYWDDTTEQFRKMRFDSTRESSGAGLVISNVIDYAKWVKCLLHETEPFSKNVHQDIRNVRMLAPQEARSGPDETVYGLAWQRKTAHGAVVYKHGGTELAYGAQVFWLPEHKYGVVTLANVAATANFAEEVIVWKLIEDKLRVSETQRFNISGSLREAFDGMKGELGHSDEILYPHRPETKRPSPLKSSQLVGTYYEQGYGEIKIVEEAHSDGSVHTTLVAERPEMLFPYHMRFQHVSGNFWTVFIWIPDVQATAGFWAGEFKTGIDGKVAGLEVKLSPPGAEIDEGTILFKKVD